MRRAARIAATAFLCAACVAPARVVTDMAGRKVSIPNRVGKVACLSNNLTVYVYTLDFRKLLGWNRFPSEKARRFLDPASLALPDLGSMPGRSMNEEILLGLHPDLVLCSDEDATMDPDAIQKRLGIPVVKVATELSRTAEVYEFLGLCLQETARARELADYARRTLEDVSRKVATVPRSRRPRIYYAEGPEGLQTDVSGSTHTEVIDFLGARNVAQVHGPSTPSMATVSIEQILSWNPEIVLVGTGRQADARGRMLRDPRWGSLQAVREGNVVRTPSLPFNWFDRPPSPARLLALRWLGSILYPRELGTDVRKETRGFYSLFYKRHLTDAELDEILSQDDRPPGAAGNGIRRAGTPAG